MPSDLEISFSTEIAALIQLNSIHNGYISKHSQLDILYSFCIGRTYGIRHGWPISILFNLRDRIDPGSTHSTPDSRCIAYENSMVAVHDSWHCFMDRSCSQLCT